MTGADVAEIVIASVAAVASIVAAGASVAERLEKRAERKALKLTPEQDFILFLASKQPDERVEMGLGPNSLGWIITPSFDGRFVSIPSDSAMVFLINSGLMAQVGTIPSKNHGGEFCSPSLNYVQTSAYQLTLPGRIRARGIPEKAARAFISEIGLRPPHA
jgi:hypothetical protein